MWESIIEDFVNRKKKERMFYLAKNKKRQDELYRELLHSPSCFDEQCIIEIAPREQTFDSICIQIKKLGGSGKCWAYSMFDEIDEQYVEFTDAIKLVLKSCSETILYFEKSGVAYYEGGHCDRLLLRRKR